MANAITKYPVPLIFKKILKDNLSGRLKVVSGSAERNFYFTRGRLDYATTTVVEERLGDVLLAMGKITQDEFNKLTKLRQSSKKKTGRILSQITSLNLQDIYYALILQMKTIALATFPLSGGEWAFTVGTPNLTDDQKFRIRLEGVIVEGIKKIKDYSYYKNRFLYRSPVTTSIPEDIGKYLSTDQIKFYIKLSNYANESVERIIKIHKVDEIFLWKTLILFYNLSVTDFIEYTVDDQLNENIEEINELHARLKKEQNVDLYELLGVKKSDPPEVIKNAYLDYTRKYHPDRIQVAPDSTVMLRANEVFAEINRAYDTLSNKDKRQEYDIGSIKKKQDDVMTAGAASRKARELYLKANTLYKHKKYWEAVSLMEEAVKLDNQKASFFMLLGLAYSKSPATRKQAEEVFLKVCKMEPWNADPFFALGELYKSENLMKKAKTYYEKALEINMEHTLAGKAVSDLNIYGKKKPVFSLFGKKK